MRMQESGSYLQTTSKAFIFSKSHSLWYLLQPPNKVNTAKAILIYITRLTFYRK